MFYILNIKVPDFHILGVEMLWFMKTIPYSPISKKRMVFGRYGFFLLIKTKPLNTNLDHLISRFALLFFSQNSSDITTITTSNIYYLTVFT